MLPRIMIGKYFQSFKIYQEVKVMKGITKVIIKMSLVALLMSVMCSMSFAVDPIKKPNVDTRKLKDAKIKLSTDLSVDGIFASRCACDLSDVNALYMNGIYVTVSNNYQKSGGAATGGTLKVTYHDLVAGHLKTVTKTVPTLKPYPTNPWTMQEFPVVTTPVLIKKSVGITAEFKSNSGVGDPKLSNNKKTVKECSVMVY
jgi:hypothetical protein